MILVDTNVWSLALRRDGDQGSAHVRAFGAALHAGEVATTGVIVQETFQGIEGPRRVDELRQLIRSVALVVPDLDDHLEAAHLGNHCRRHGVQLTTVDALLAALCVRRDLPILTADQDFDHAARLVPIRIWRSTDDSPA